MGFREIVPTYAPPWMRGPRGETLLESVGAALDERAAQVMWARLQSNPFAGGANALRWGAARLADGRLIECDPWVLPIHAEQRGIRIYDTEPELSRRVRLSRWWQLHQRRGTHRGVMEHVQPYFLTLATALPVIRIVHQDGAGASATWHTLDAFGTYSVTRVTPSNFNYDGQASKWARWWAFVYMSGTGIAPPITYGSGHVYGDGSIYGVKGFSAAQQADIASMFLDWQAAHSLCSGIAIVWNSGDVNPAGTPTQDLTGWWSLPNGTWGNIVDPTTRLGTRPPTVQWIYEAAG